MDHLYIICVDDQREVLTALSKDLEVFEKNIRIEECESVNEAWEVIDEVDAEGDHLALVITDQVMPQNTGVDLLQKLKEDARFSSTKTILLTGLASHEDTINAINLGSLNHYIEKPWDREKLQQVIRQLVTHFLLEKGLDYTEYDEVLDQETLINHLRHTTG